MERIQVVQFCLLLLVVPLQYYLTTGNVADERNYSLVTFINKASHVFNVTSFNELCVNFLKLLRVNNGTTIPELTEKDMFASSLDPRTPRSSKILFKVGDLVKSKRTKIRGVVIGWDERVMSGRDMFKRLLEREDYSSIEGEIDEIMTEPAYLLLMHGGDVRHTLLRAYVPQRALLPMEPPLPISHNDIDEYFERWDYQRRRYIPRPVLQKIYPHDL